MTERRVPRAEPPPEDLKEIQIRHRETTAAGIPAIVQTMRFGFGEMGALRTLKTLTTLNQKGGVDCPSCAWPDPDGHRSVAEFCENGAKAVSEEATLSCVPPAFFAEQSVSGPGGAERPLAEQAGAPDTSHASAPGRSALRTDLLGRGFPVNWKRTERACLAG